MTGTHKPTLTADYNVHVQICERLSSYSLLTFMTVDVNQCRQAVTAGGIKYPTFLFTNYDGENQ